VRQAAALMVRIADAVHYAHKRGLVHRDIKPSNIFLSREMKPKVLDFGVALPRSERDPGQQTQLIGTPNYMSPEQARGLPIDARSDVFSLGTILYEMVTGKRAFDAPSVDELLAKLVNEEPTPVADLRPETPPELVRIIGKALAKDIEARYQTAGDLRNDLAAFAGNRDPETQELRPPRTGTSIAPAARRRKLIWSALAALTLFVLGSVVWLKSGPEEPPEVPTVVIRPRPVTPPPTPPTQNAEQPGGGTITEVRPTPVMRKPSLAAAPPADGQLTLAIAPWGEVLVNGERRGVSPPLTKMSLPPGSYTIEVRNGDAPPLKTSIDIRPGQAHTLRHRF
jgi:serine/threonine-protein kinase